MQNHCCRRITPYERNAIDLFPDFRNDRISVARFLCQTRKKTFSLLPVQLIPYMQYTAAAVLCTLLAGLEHWQAGMKGFLGAVVEVHPDSLVSPWLVVCWLKMVVGGLRRCHLTLSKWYDFGSIATVDGTHGWQEVKGYFQAFGWRDNPSFLEKLQELMRRYSRAIKGFVFGTPSQWRGKSTYLSP
jgi:hypothetical protein